MLRRHFITNNSQEADYVITYYADEKILIPNIKYYGIAYDYIKNKDLDGELDFKILKSEYDTNSGVGKWYIKILNNVDNLKIACTAYSYIYDKSGSGGGGINIMFMSTGLDYNSGDKSGLEYDKRGKITKIIIPEDIEQTILLCTTIRTYNNDYTRILDSISPLQEIILPTTIKIIGHSTFMGCKIPIITIPPYVEEIHWGAFAFTESNIELPFIPPKIKHNYYDHQTDYLKKGIYLFGEGTLLIKPEDSIRSKFKCYPGSLDLYLENEDWQTYKDLFDGYIDNTIVVVNGSIDGYNHINHYYYENDNIGSVRVYRYNNEYNGNTLIVGNSIKKLYINNNCRVQHTNNYHINKGIEEIYLLGKTATITAYNYSYGDSEPDITTDIKKVYYDLEYVKVNNYKSTVWDSAIFLLKDVNDLTLGDNVKYIPDNFLYIEKKLSNETLNFDFRNLEVLGSYFIKSYNYSDNYANVIVNMQFSDKIKYIGFHSMHLGVSYNIHVDDINTITKIHSRAGISNIAFNDCKINFYINGVLLESGELTIDVINNPCFNRINLPNIDIKLSDNVKSLPNNCFKYSSINSINLNKVEFIGEECFSNLYKRIDIVIPNTVKYIGGDAFSMTNPNNVDKLNVSIEDLNSLDHVGVNAFKYTNIEETLTEDIVYIGKTLYKINSTTITDIVCKEGIEYVNLNIPDSVETIVLPNGIKEINYNSKLNHVGISINKNSNLYKNSDLGGIYVNNYLISYKGGFFRLNHETELIAQNALEDGLIELIPISLNNLKYINDGAFKNATIDQYRYTNNRVKDDLALPQNVEIIGNYVFNGTKFFDFTGKIICGNKLKHIGTYAFANDNITIIDLSNTIIETLNECFANTKNLHEVNLPKSIKNINYCDFANVPKLTNLSYAGTIEEWNAIEKDTKYWYINTKVTKVICTDGEVILED